MTAPSNEAMALYRIAELDSQTKQSLYVARLVWLSRVRLHQPNGDVAGYVEKLVGDFFSDTPYESLYEASAIIFEAARRPFDDLDGFLAVLNRLTSDRMMQMAGFALPGYVRLLRLSSNPYEAPATAKVLEPLVDTPHGRKVLTWVLTNYKPLRDVAGEDQFGRVRIAELAEVFGVKQPRTITQSNSRVARDIRRARFELGEGEAEA